MEICLAISEWSRCYLHTQYSTEISFFSKSPVEKSANTHQKICTRILLKDKLRNIKVLRVYSRKYQFELGIAKVEVAMNTLQTEDRGKTLYRRWGT